ncbi:protein TAPT1 homolog isoform X1 [Dendroctonus ponderosae]|uniref:Gustatory receptor n=1 Tax=Dendroctonus ponderosae TaxID=77166 RepID=A0AAR5Q877_DENPD|nr:protein TAPT1 homolog isoform X1 [Dendroctonus ponderosae]
MEERAASALEKKLRFRQPAKTWEIDENIENLAGNDERPHMDHPKTERSSSLFSFLKTEVTRNYLLENDEERFSIGREKFYLFMKIPKELEKFLFYGVMHCTDSFLFVYTYLPVRVFLALSALVSRLFSTCFGSSHTSSPRILSPAEICDLLKAVILIVSIMVLWLIDTNMMYHLIKSQSVIKLYIFYNMLDIGDRLLISLGQDTIDALLWTATEPRGRKREHLGLIPHLFLAIIYVIMHSILILFQATTLNVAVNANNKALLTIMMSNNFVELKGSVFKKFDKNNLFQVSCSDVRERFHLVVLLFVVILQTMREYNWKIDILWQLIFDSFAVLVAELLVDWIKHAFITRFNELNADVYKDYRTSIAYDLTHKLQKHPFSGHSDLVARRMGFIALPLGVLCARVLFSAIHLYNLPAMIIFLIGYLGVWSLKILNTILIFGMACRIIAQHKLERTAQNSPVNNVESRDKLRNVGASSPQHAIFKSHSSVLEDNELKLSISGSDLAAAAIFANSTVDLKDARLNEELLKNSSEDLRMELSEEIVTRSVPDIKKELKFDETVGAKNEVESLKKSESEPSLVNLADNQVKDL